MIESDIRKIVVEISKKIPNFIDTTSEDDYNVHLYISKIIKIFSLCIIGDMFSDERINELAVEYYSLLLYINTKYNVLYKTSVDYIVSIYKSLITDLEENNLYEAAYNLYNITRYE